MRKAVEHMAYTLIIAISNLSYTSIAPVLPLELQRRDLSVAFSGIIFT